jgi:hypothetical protein
VQFLYSKLKEMKLKDVKSTFLPENEYKQMISTLKTEKDIMASEFEKMKISKNKMVAALEMKVQELQEKCESL